MRSAEAAKNTAELIDGTVKNVHDGSTLVSTTNEAFRRVTDSAARVGDLIAEISEASKEQSSSIEQVNIAITEIDKVVQQNAANAEESASTASEMNSQAEQLKNLINDLIFLVMGKRNLTTDMNRIDQPSHLALKQENISRHDKQLIYPSKKPV
jgi:methyl-accepting chemotaxis protein